MFPFIFFPYKKNLKFKLTKGKCIQIILVINDELRKATISIFRHPNHFHSTGLLRGINSINGIYSWK